MVLTGYQLVLGAGIVFVVGILSGIGAGRVVSWQQPVATAPVAVFSPVPTTPLTTGMGTSLPVPLVSSGSLTETVSPVCRSRAQLGLTGLPEAAQWCQVPRLLLCEAAWCLGYWMNAPTVSEATLFYDCNQRQADRSAAYCVPTSRGELEDLAY